ncbi:pyridine nucleotide-disulfide oxidoreductase [Intrasporangium chromatireducens Q5-1]|uniref:Pyridine nucleotide-disulfide oxidoreductase n=1 Tax=Intrasporangium chromatireducens Q5-1 TaxID=584657 RepID=W9GL19_9MICO|nr:FAD-dependent oxidoreductase [Intrasporangium chromatireducens]EWT06961.1 pyridine nucleotide-disulfide oxidoreductase [Intrasporangium chromatireducens Q5-1]
MSTDAASIQGQTSYVIIGGGLTAARAVEGIRESDADGRITVIAAEQHLPYERPPLSKGVMLGKDEEDVVFPHDRAWYDEQHVDLRLGTTATAIDTAAHTVTLSDGESLPWSRLLLATGSSVRTLEVDGADLQDIFYLRTLDDCEALKARLVAGSDVVIVGAGWIGLEVAAAAREHGCEVTVVEPQDAPLQGVVGPEVGGWFADLHRSHGVEFRFGEGVERFTGNADHKVDGVVTSAGDTIRADTVVVGVGIRPTTELAEAAGLTVDNGVVTDAALRTSVPDIYAAGDVANWRSETLGTNLRVEHWANANDGGTAAGKSMAGQDVTYDPIPFFFSDQYDAGLEYSGYVPRGLKAEVVLRGDPKSNEFMAFWLDGDRVLAGMHVNVWDTVPAIEQLVRDKTPVDRTKLADPDVPLSDVRS